MEPETHEVTHLIRIPFSFWGTNCQKPNLMKNSGGQLPRGLSIRTANGSAGEDFPIFESKDLESYFRGMSRLTFLKS